MIKDERDFRVEIEEIQLQCKVKGRQFCGQVQISIFSSILWVLPPSSILNCFTYLLIITLSGSTFSLPSSGSLPLFFSGEM